MPYYNMTLKDAAVITAKKTMIDKVQGECTIHEMPDPYWGQQNNKVVEDKDHNIYRDASLFKAWGRHYTRFLIIY